MVADQALLQRTLDFLFAANVPVPQVKILNGQKPPNDDISYKLNDNLSFLFCSMVL